MWSGPLDQLRRLLNALPLLSMRRHAIGPPSQPSQPNTGFEQPWSRPNSDGLPSATGSKPTSNTWQTVRSLVPGRPVFEGITAVSLGAQRVEALECCSTTRPTAVCVVNRLSLGGCPSAVEG